jgi:Uma2 family endonuclease
MSSTVEAPPSVAARQSSADQRFVLWNVGWDTYELLLKQLGDRPVRLTYDGQNLELMSPSRWHEIVKSILGRLVEALALELDIPLSGGGSTTFRREDLQRGLEPDECYWIANAARVRGKRELDLYVDPPPDLVIEVDISRSSLDRQGIYAKLRVPEIWRFDGQRLEVLLLQSDGQYAISPQSAAFPFLPVQELVQFIEMAEQTDDTTCLKRFQKWVRDQQFQP